MLDDDGKLYSKFLNKRNNAAKEGIDFLLSYSNFKALVKDAGLSSSDLGFSGGGYVLARFGDEGPYSLTNCRFITQKENAAERKVTKRSRLASRKNVKSATRALYAIPKKIRKAQLSDGGSKGAASRNAYVKEELEKSDRKLKQVDVDTEIVNYPVFGWKTRLARQFSITKRVLDRFLERNPTFVSGL